jgi:hypothetical protein
MYNKICATVKTSNEEENEEMVIMMRIKVSCIMKCNYILLV